MDRIRYLIIIMSLLSSLIFAGEEHSILHNYTTAESGFLLLIPELQEADSIKSFFNSNKPDYAVEMLYQFPSTELIVWRDLYFKLRGISRLEEVTYFSEHIHDYRKMFEKAYMIESSRKKKQIPDFTEDTEFNDASVYAYLDEVVLGKGTYNLDYEVSESSIAMTLQNISNLSMFIRLVDKENFYLKFIFYEENGLLKVYLFGSYTLENEFIIRKVLKYPHSTLAKRVYTIFVKLIDGFHGAELEESFPDYLRE